MSEAIFAIIFPVATPALTVRPVASKISLRIASRERARLFERRLAESDEGFVERETFDRLTSLAKIVEDLARDGFVLLHVGRDDEEIGARHARLVERHRGTHSVRPRFVRGGEHDRAPAASGDRDGLAAQRRIVADRDAGVERVDVEVRDERFDYVSG